MAVNQSVQVSAPVTQIPFAVDEWLFKNIDGSKDAVRKMILAGEIGRGHHMLTKGCTPIDDYCFKVYAVDEAIDRLNIYWNNGSSINFTTCSIEYTKSNSRYDYDDGYFGGCC